ncbi:MAG: HAMP domain-containing histidine kinase [Bacteroidetes bacterium]|nr:HAMP domain-containing histidine kinase [Bacteroidota bacterium]
MKLNNKLTLVNTASKLLIFIAIVFLVPFMVRKVVLDLTDKRLVVMQKRVIGIIDKVGINNFIRTESDSSFASYNILKEEYISLEPISDSTKISDKINNDERNIENVIVDYRVLSSVFLKENKKYLLEIGKSLSNINQLDNTIKKFALYILIAILIITVITDITFTNYFLRPFKTIIEKKLKPISNPTDFDFREIKTTTDDFRILEKTIHEMMEKINYAFLREKDFTSHVSHELLTPISLLQSRLENILSDQNISENVALKVIESQKTLTRLKKIINALLMISKIEHEQYLKEDAVNMKYLVADVLEEIDERFEEKKLNVDVKAETDFVIQGNKSLLFTLLFNLINNAIRYNVTHGRIFIRTFFENKKFIIEVEDSGIGIPQEKIKMLFDRFKKMKFTDEESHGLGLPIVKAIADFHNIMITISSSEGKGTVFKLIFPS